jgi:hypothetical protein
VDEVSKTISAAAIAAIMKLSKHGSKEQKEHFAEMLTMLADCYDDERNQKAVIIMSNDEVMATLSINADPWDTAGMVSACYDKLNLQAFQKMPEHYQAH